VTPSRSTPSGARVEHEATCNSRTAAGGATTNSGRWRAGVSGNPAGRRPGTSEVARLRAAIATQVPDILAKLVAKAKRGDIAAARLLLERVVPPLRPIDEVVPITLAPGSLSDQGREVFDALCAGAIPPAQAAGLIANLADLSRLVETDELNARVAALEKRHAG
jgi:hypothetical protein